MNRLMQLGQYLVCGLLVLLGGLAQAETPADFAHQIPIATNGEGPFFHLALPLDVYQGSHSIDLRDLRVFNGAGELVPHALVSPEAKGEVVYRQTSLPWFPLYEGREAAVPSGVQVRQDARGTLVAVTPVRPVRGSKERRVYGAVLDASKVAAPLQTLQFGLLGGEAFQRFTLEASDDLRRWTSVPVDGVLARLEQEGVSIVQDKVELPALRARYLKLVWAEPATAPRLTRVLASSSETTAPTRELLWTDAITPTQSDPGTYDYRLPARLPVERVSFELPELNSLAPARLYGRGDVRERWGRLLDTVLYRLQAGTAEARSGDLSLNGGGISELRLVVEEKSGGLGDRPPFLRVGYVPRFLVFLARGTGPFFLAYGNGSLSSSALPLTTLVPQYHPEDGLPGVQATLLPERSVETTSPVPAVEASLPPSVDRKWLLWGILVVGVGVLLVMAWGLLRSGRGGNPPA